MSSKSTQLAHSNIIAAVLGASDDLHATKASGRACVANRQSNTAAPRRSSEGAQLHALTSQLLAPRIECDFLHTRASFLTLFQLTLHIQHRWTKRTPAWSSGESTSRLSPHTEFAAHLLNSPLPLPQRKNSKACICNSRGVNVLSFWYATRQHATFRQCLQELRMGPPRTVPSLR
ncbi:hypothetical protein P389DRAFT_30552 [Cystobasidium minutum MCA 4210]|uniref:uncharacterized protein n=1 Tax=Cystobasidium minutum MCA 4210 TaxID=1397322 RepID=UPI0034CD8BDC|eukprot:jgi/Rhomi1/30552/CE30551_111